MPDTSMKEIVGLCIWMEKEAAKIYQIISEQTTSDEESAFWRDISLDEERHVTYWERLLALEEKGSLRNVFDRPDKTRDEIEALKHKVETTLSEAIDLSEIATAALLAFRLESVMMNPAFAILFHIMRKEAGDKSPEDDYQEHIDKFSHFVRRFATGKPELELISEILSNMWAHNRELAHQFVEIKTLEGMIPICSVCKKIRDDGGYWKQIEFYLSEHTEARFSHGICPDCAKRLYPESYKGD